MLTTNDQRIIVSDRHGHLATSYPGRGYTEHEPGHFPERHSSVRSALALGLRILRAQRRTESFTSGRCTGATPHA
jgi:hypothetical protein